MELQPTIVDVLAAVVHARPQRRMPLTQPGHRRAQPTRVQAPHRHGHRVHESVVMPVTEPIGPRQQPLLLERQRMVPLARPRGDLSRPVTALLYCPCLQVSQRVGEPGHVIEPTRIEHDPQLPAQAGGDGQGCQRIPTAGEEVVIGADHASQRLAPGAPQRVLHDHRLHPASFASQSRPCG